MIRVVHVVPDFSNGGGQRVASHLLHHLNRSRFEPFAVSLFGRLGTEMEMAFDRAGIPVLYLDKRRGFDARTFLLLAQAIAHIKPDVIHTHTYALRYALPSICFRTEPVGCLHTVHNLARFEACHADRILYRLAFRRLGVLPVAIAATVKASVTEEYAIDCPSVSLGIPVDRYCAPSRTRSATRVAFGAGEHETVLVSVGRLVDQKNHRLMLAAMRILKERAQNCRLWAVGGGPLAGYLQNLVNDLNISDRVTFLGQRSDIPDILAAADIAVSSSDWEGTPLSLMEALAAGKPVVATEVGGVAEIVSSGITGILVPSGNASALADAIAGMCSNRAALLKMGDAARHDARERFNVQRMTRSYEDLYIQRLSALRGMQVKTKKHALPN